MKKICNVRKRDTNRTIVKAELKGEEPTLERERETDRQRQRQKDKESDRERQRKRVRQR
jgi:hypothetical protein